jgi:hypothetical protein
LDRVIKLVSFYASEFVLALNLLSPRPKRLIVEHVVDALSD